MNKESINAIYELKNESSSLAKEDIIRRNMDNEDFIKYLKYLLDPLVTYNISEYTIRSDDNPYYNEQYSLVNTGMTVFDICDMVSKLKALTNTQIELICDWIYNSKFEDDERELYIGLLSKSIKLGVTAKTVNKVIPNLIPLWEVQQGYPIEKYPIRDGEWFTLTQKLNGNRCTYYKGNLYTRTGSKYIGLDHIINGIEESFKRIYPYENVRDYVFDGELLLKDDIKQNESLSDNEAFRKATGILNSEIVEDKKQIYYNIFDVIELNDFDGISKSHSTYRTRRTVLDHYIRKGFDTENVRILPALYQGTDQSMIWKLLEQMVKEDKEGLMANLDTEYKRTRHRGILKVKQFYSMDLPIIGIERGSGKLSHTLGALVLDFKGNEVRVGSGFTDEDRKRLWEARALIGKLCEVKYKEISKDKKTQMESLQFPVFVRIRDDKDEPSYG